MTNNDLFFSKLEYLDELIAKFNRKAKNEGIAYQTHLQKLKTLSKALNAAIETQYQADFFLNDDDWRSLLSQSGLPSKVQATLLEILQKHEDSKSLEEVDYKDFVQWVTKFYVHRFSNHTKYLDNISLGIPIDETTYHAYLETAIVLTLKKKQIATTPLDISTNLILLLKGRLQESDGNNGETQLITNFISCKTPLLAQNTITDPRDGQQYSYTKIGDCYWMMENIRYKAVGSRWNTNNPDTLYGRLYDYYGALEACPKGWRLSTNLAWFELETAVLDMARNEELQADYFRGKKIKVLKSKDNWTTPGTDLWKLNFLPAGKATLEPDAFSLLNSDAFFWVYSVDTKQNIIMEYRQINDSETGIYRSKKVNEEDISKEGAPYPFMSCCCIKRIN